MAHIEQREFFESVKRLFPYFFNNVSVLEVGSLDINGSVRDLFSATRYVGVDLGEGAGVDVVGRGEDLWFADGEFDVCISAECFEHNPEWLATFDEMVRVAGQLVIMTCATEGRAEHGTTQSNPGASPLTADSNYYQNLVRTDFPDAYWMNRRFADWHFSTNDVSHDLYFWGVKR